MTSAEFQNDWECLSKNPNKVNKRPELSIDVEMKVHVWDWSDLMKKSNILKHEQVWSWDDLIHNPNLDERPTKKARTF